MRAPLFIKVLFIIGFFSSTAAASLIERDYLGVTGGITYDTETELEWLDLTFTDGLGLVGYHDYLNELDAGWRFASSVLVSQLFTNFNFTFDQSIDNIYGSIVDKSDHYTINNPSLTFFEHVKELGTLGHTTSNNKFHGVKGFTSDIRGSLNEQYMVYYTTSRNTGVASAGDFIRTPKEDLFDSFFTYRVNTNFQQANVNAPVLSAPAIAVPEPATLGLFSLFLCLMGFRKIKG